MATVIDRIDELNHLLGLSQNQFTLRLGIKARAAYTNWKNGQEPDKDTICAIARRWCISLDSLYAEEGTHSIEPSPQLEAAQQRLVALFSGHDVHTSIFDRVMSVHKVISSTTGMSKEAWCEWMQESPEGWDQLVATRTTPTRILKHVAFLAGWYAGQAAWMEWLKEGHKDSLTPQSDAEQKRIMQYIAMKGWTKADLMRLGRE